MIKKAGYRYNFINIIVLLITTISFLDKYIATEQLFDNIEFLQILILILQYVWFMLLRRGDFIWLYMDQI